MEQLTKNLTPMLFDEGMSFLSFNEVAFRVKGGTEISTGDQFPVNESNKVDGLPANIQYVTVSRIGQACEKTPAFELNGYDLTGAAYGTLQAIGETHKWRCDGSNVWTTLAIQDESELSREELHRVALFPVVAWCESTVPEMKGFRSLYQKGEATANDCIKFSSAFSYGYLKPTNSDVTIHPGSSDTLCSPQNKPNIVIQKDSSHSFNLPWQKSNDIPNDLSVSSAIAGKYALNGQWGVVSENGKSYNFQEDMIDRNELQDYIDNPDFRDALQQIIGYIGSLFRTNDLTWDDTPMNQFLESHSIKMKYSIQQNMMFAGDPGAGKTLLCRMLAATLGLPCICVRLGERSEKEEMTQEVVATSNGFEMLKSRIYWYVKHGGMIIFDDLSNADPNLFFSVAGGLLESPYEYIVNQEKIQRHPLCLMVATTNVGTVGSQAMNEALLTRFGGHYVVEKMSDDVFKSCIQHRAISNSGAKLSNKTTNQIINWSYNVYRSVSKAIKNVDRETADRLITLRAAIGTAEKIMNALADDFPVDAKKSARQTMANILYTGGNPTLQKAVADAIDSVPALTI